MSWKMEVVNYSLPWTFCACCGVNVVETATPRNNKLYKNQETGVVLCVPCYNAKRDEEQRIEAQREEAERLANCIHERCEVVECDWEGRATLVRCLECGQTNYLGGNFG